MFTSLLNTCQKRLTIVTVQEQKNERDHFIHVFTPNFDQIQLARFFESVIVKKFKVLLRTVLHTC